MTLVGSTRADDIVRDADILHLYKKAGVERFLMGMENTDEATLDLIRKGGSTTKDREAIRLMRQHDMLSMATWVVGFEEETDRDLWRGLKQLLSYDPDQIQTLYVTPHRWTPFFRIAADRRVIQTDQSPLGLQAPGAGDPPHAAVAADALGEVHRGDRAAPPQGAAARAVSSRPQNPPRACAGTRAWAAASGPTRSRASCFATAASPTARRWPQFWGAPQDAEEEAMASKQKERSIASFNADAQAA